jgi:molybdate transport system permease protein
VTVGARLRDAAPAGLLVGALALAVAFLALPLVALLAEVPLGRVPGLLGRAEVRDALAVTARTTLIANALTLAVGTPAAYLLATRRFPGRGALVTILELPLVLPPAVAGVALLSAFGRGGLLGDALADGGIVLPFTQWAVVLAIVFVASPFYLRQAIAAFAAVDPVLVGTARTLGAGRWRTFARVTLPLAASGLTAAWVIAFARGVGEFGATIIFAGSVRGRTQTLTLTIYDQLDGHLDVAISIGVLLVVLSAVLLASYKLVSWRRSTSGSAPAFAPSISTSR